MAHPGAGNSFEAQLLHTPFDKEDAYAIADINDFCDTISVTC